MPRYVVITEVERSDYDKPGWPTTNRLIVSGTLFDDVYKARAHATKRASETNRPYIVAEVLGEQMPVYDPEIGWKPESVLRREE